MSWRCKPFQQRKAEGTLYYMRSDRLIGWVVFHHVSTENEEMSYSAKVKRGQTVEAKRFVNSTSIIKVVKRLKGLLAKRFSVLKQCVY